MARRQVTRLCDHCGIAFTREQRYPHPTFCSKYCAVHARPTRPPVERFWTHINKTSDCWLWTGGTYSYGYGCFFWGHDEISSNGMRPSHRVAYELTYGPIPDGLKVLHRCDNPPCCRPDHLFLGTDATNSADKVQKRRHTYGMTQTLSKLTDDDVRVIRAESAAGATRLTMARRFHVSQVTITKVVLCQTWKHVT